MIGTIKFLDFKYKLDQIKLRKNKGIMQSILPCWSENNKAKSGVDIVSGTIEVSHGYIQPLIIYTKYMCDYFFLRITDNLFLVR